MPYTSSPGGLFDSGVFPDSRPRIDVGSILGAVGQGTGSIIHSVLMRKQADTENNLRQAQATRDNAMVEIERQREAREAQSQQQEFGLRQQAERHRFIEAGGIPAHTDTQAVGESTPLTPVNPQPTSPIRGAMGAGAPSLPGPQLTPGSSGVPVAPAQAATVYHPENVDTPESYDPKRGAAYERGFMMADMRNQGWVTRDQARGEIQAQNQQAHDQRVAAMRTAATKGAQAIAQMRVNAKNASPIKSAALSAQAERGRLAAASDVVGNAGGSLDDATNFLASDDPAAKNLRDNGVTPYHLMQAHANYVNQSTGQAVRLQSGAMGMAPDEAVGAVSTTRNLVGGKKPPASGGDTAAPSGAAPAPKLRAPAKPAAAASSKSAPADDFSDDEIADAMKAGKTTEDDVRKYIVAQRQKKGGKK